MRLDFSHTSALPLILPKLNHDTSQSSLDFTIRDQACSLERSRNNSKLNLRENLQIIPPYMRESRNKSTLQVRKPKFDMTFSEPNHSFIQTSP